MSTDGKVYRKYEVIRTDGKPVVEAFVIELKDPYAKAALSAYADACEATHPQLAADMRERYRLDSAAPVTDMVRPVESDREVLMYLMQQFDCETWSCERCGHEEDTATMDSAHYLRRYLAIESAAAPGMGGEDAEDAKRWRYLRDNLPREYNHEKGFVRWYLPRRAGGFMSLQEHIDFRLEAIRFNNGEPLATHPTPTVAGSGVGDAEVEAAQLAYNEYTGQVQPGNHQMRAALEAAALARRLGEDRA
jgi:hypothetical protein